MPSLDTSFESLRSKHYNATLLQRQDVNDELFRIRIRPDKKFSPFEPGQYVAIGLGYWEKRIQPSQREDVPPEKWEKLVLRAYSISCPLIDSSGEVVTCNDLDHIELYVALVRGSDGSDMPPPSLTPRLFGLVEGDRIFMSAKISGKYTLAGVGPEDTVLMIGTGTGEAPHNAMVAELIRRRHQGKIVNVTSVRYHKDLGYLREHQLLMAKHPNYRYIPLTTREAENLNPSHPGYVGKQYIQDLVRTQELHRMAGDPLLPQNTHAFLCGNPAMIGFVPPGGAQLQQPGVLTLLQEAGFIREEAGCGHVRFEKYW